DFESSALFTKIYSEAFGTAGGLPFSLILGDYEVKDGHRQGLAMHDAEITSNLAKIMSLAFCPLIMGASSQMLGLVHFHEMGPTTAFSPPPGKRPQLSPFS